MLNRTMPNKLMEENKINPYVVLFLFLLYSPSLKSDELECNSSNINSFVFSRISPIEASTSSSLKEKEYINTRYGIAYPIVLQQRRKLKICINNNKYWVKKSHVALTNSPEWVFTNPSALKLRPKLTLWRSRERLSTYLARTNATAAPPDYIESQLVKKYIGSFKLAVDKSDVMEMKIKGKQVDVASLLIPFPLTALKKYKIIQLEKKKTDEIKFVVVIDTSGSTKGFVKPFLTHLSQSWNKSILPPIKNIMLLTFDSDGYASSPRFISSTNFSSLKFKKRDIDTIGKESKGVLKAIISATKKVRSQKYKPTLIILSGGDVSVSKSRYLNTFGKIKLVQITPEIQLELQKSLDDVVKVQFIEFKPNNTNILLKEIIRITNNYNKNKSALDYEDIAPEFGKRKMLPLLPNNLDLDNLATPPAYVTENTDWFVVNLWTVVNGELVKFDE